MADERSPDAILDRAEAALTPSAGPSEVARQRMWRAIQPEARGPAAPRRLSLVGASAISTAAIAASVLIVSWPSAQQPARRPAGSASHEPRRSGSERFAVQEPTHLIRGGARLRLDAATTLEVRELRTSTLIRLERGALDVSAPTADAPPVVVATEWARLEMVSGRFRATVGAGGLETVVSAGELAVGPPANPRVLKAGQRLRLPVGPHPRKDRVVVTDRPEDRDPRPVRRPARDARRALDPGASRLSDEAPLAPAQGRASRPAASPKEPADAEALTLLQRADAARQQGALVEAAALYARLEADPAVAGYAEEAMLRHARLLVRLDRSAEAEVVLQTAARRFTDGPLAPERAMLHAELHLRAGRARRAADVLGALDVSRRAGGLIRLRWAVANALVRDDPAAACAFIRPTLAAASGRAPSWTKECSPLEKD